jgi:hypothetical protein
MSESIDAILVNLPEELRDLARWANKELPASVTIDLYQLRSVNRDGTTGGVLFIGNDHFQFRFGFGNTGSCPDDRQGYVLIWTQVNWGKVQCFHSTIPVNEALELMKNKLLVLFLGGRIPTAEA